MSSERISIRWRSSVSLVLILAISDTVKLGTALIARDENRGIPRVSLQPCDDLIDFLSPSPYQHVWLFLSLSLLVRRYMCHLIYGASNSNSIVILKRFLTSRQMCISIYPFMASGSFSLRCCLSSSSSSSCQRRNGEQRYKGISSRVLCMLMGRFFFSLYALVPISLPLQRRAVNWPGPFPATERFLPLCVCVSFS